MLDNLIRDLAMQAASVTKKLLGLIILISSNLLGNDFYCYDSDSDSDRGSELSSVSSDDEPFLDRASDVVSYVAETSLKRLLVFLKWSQRFLVGSKDCGSANVLKLSSEQVVEARLEVEQLLERLKALSQKLAAVSVNLSLCQRADQAHLEDKVERYSRTLAQLCERCYFTSQRLCKIDLTTITKQLWLSVLQKSTSELEAMQTEYQNIDDAAKHLLVEARYEVRLLKRQHLALISVYRQMQIQLEGLKKLASMSRMDLLDRLQVYEVKLRDELGLPLREIGRLYSTLVWKIMHDQDLQDLPGLIKVGLNALENVVCQLAAAERSLVACLDDKK